MSENSPAGDDVVMSEGLPAEVPADDLDVVMSEGPGAASDDCNILTVNIPQQGCMIKVNLGSEAAEICSKYKPVEIVEMLHMMSQDFRLSSDVFSVVDLVTEDLKEEDLTEEDLTEYAMEQEALQKLEALKEEAMKQEDVKQETVQQLEALNEAEEAWQKLEAIKQEGVKPETLHEEEAVQPETLLEEAMKDEAAKEEAVQQESLHEEEAVQPETLLEEAMKDEAEGEKALPAQTDLKAEASNCMSEIMKPYDSDDDEKPKINMLGMYRSEPYRPNSRGLAVAQGIAQQYRHIFEEPLCEEPPPMLAPAVLPAPPPPPKRALRSPSREPQSAASAASGSSAAAQGAASTASQASEGRGRVTEAWRPQPSKEGGGRFGNRGGRMKEWYTALNHAKKFGPDAVQAFYKSHPKPQPKPRAALRLLAVHHDRPSQPDMPAISAVGPLAKSRGCVYYISGLPLFDEQIGIGNKLFRCPCFFLGGGIVSPLNTSIAKNNT